MKKPIVVSVIMVFMLLSWSFFAAVHAQDPAKEEKPTFYRLVPGTYVNGYPRFIVRYPKDWVERRAPFPVLFRASPPGSPVMGRGFSVSYASIPLPVPSLDKWVDFMVPYFKRLAKDVTVVNDRPSQLRDGTPARELEIKMVVNTEPRNWFGVAAVATKKGDLLVVTQMTTDKATIGEDLRAIPYSIELDLGKDEPVKLPPDIQAFLDRHNNDLISHDVAKAMANYSDKYLDSGIRKGERERIIRQGITPQGIDSLMSYKMTITDFVPAGDRAYLTGFVIINNLFTNAITDTTIIKESGEWKWYGNQRDPAP
jgi:hypothetical protein